MTYLLHIDLPSCETQRKRRRTRALLQRGSELTNELLKRRERDYAGKEGCRALSQKMTRVRGPLDGAGLGLGLPKRRP